MKIRILAFLFVSLCIFVGCDKKDSSDSAKELAKERSVAEAEVQKQYDKQKAETEAQIQKEIENKNQAQKALAMEADLAARHSFYSAMEGDYEGSLKIDNDTYKIKMIFARSIPPYTDDRVRQLSEIEVDLNSLYIQAKIVQWHPADQATAVGCQINGSKPNMVLGNMTLSSNECPNFYQISFSEDAVFEVAQNAEKAKKLALKIKSGQADVVPFLFGLIQPSNNAAKYSFIAKKTK